MCAIPSGPWKGGALAPPSFVAGLESPLGPEAKPLQGLKPVNYLARLAAGLKPRPSSSYEKGFFPQGQSLPFTAAFSGLSLGLFQPSKPKHRVAVPATYNRRNTKHGRRTEEAGHACPAGA